jgi:hypothetical protein
MALKPLEHVADTLVRAIESLGIDPVELAHALGQIGVRRLDHQMVVIAHLATRVNDPVETVADVRKRLPPDDAVVVAKVNVFPPIATGRHMG